MIMRIYTSTTLGLLLLISLGAHAGSARAQSPEEYLTEYGQALVDAYAPLDTAISDSSATVSTIQVERHRLVTLSGFGANGVYDYVGFHESASDADIATLVGHTDSLLQVFEAYEAVMANMTLPPLYTPLPPRPSLAPPFASNVWTPTDPQALATLAVATADAADEIGLPDPAPMSWSQMVAGLGNDLAAQTAYLILTTMGFDVSGYVSSLDVWLELILDLCDRIDELEDLKEDQQAEIDHLADQVELASEALDETYDLYIDAFDRWMSSGDAQAMQEAMAHQSIMAWQNADLKDLIDKLDAAKEELAALCFELTILEFLKDLLL